MPPCPRRRCRTFEDVIVRPLRIRPDENDGVDKGKQFLAIEFCLLCYFHVPCWVAMLMIVGSLQLIVDGIRRLEGSPLLLRPESSAVNECKCSPPLRVS